MISTQILKYVKKIATIVLILIIIFGSLNTQVFALEIEPSRNDLKREETIKKDYVEGEILIKYKDEKIDLKSSLGRSASVSLFSAESLERKEDLIGNNISVFRIKDHTTVEQKIEELKNDPNIEFVEPNYKRYPLVISTNDTFRTNLWGLDNIGQLVDDVTGTNDADIDAPEAWAISDGTSTDVIVAVIDSGVAYNHPDLIGNMWNGISCKNENGIVIGNCNYGYDFEDNDKTPLPTTSSHGTHVAGTIAGTKGNNKGIIGVAPNAKIMAIKSSLSVSDNIKSIDFAIQNGAKIINASYGGSSFSGLEYNAINRFRTAGGLFVAAAGNSATNNETGHLYPSDYDLDNIISVAATDQNDILANFSSFGNVSVDVGAPGTNIQSLTDYTSVTTENFNGVIEPNLPMGWTKNGDWGTYELSGGDNVLASDYINEPYANNIDSDASSPVYNLSGNTTISFYAACDTEYFSPASSDYIALQFDGGSGFEEEFRWNETTLDSLNGDASSAGGAGYDFESYPIPSEFLTSNFRFGFKWHTNSSNSPAQNYFGCVVDDIEISSFSDGSDENYNFRSGTSMAAPYVAGLAALMYGYVPNLPYSQIKSIILNTGDSLGALSGKTVSGKRINAYNTLASMQVKAITAFTVPNQVGTTTINELTHSIILDVPYSTNLTSLIPSITITGVSVNPGSGVSNNFTSTTTYTVTAIDSLTQIYDVKINLLPPSSITTITSSAYTVDNASSTIVNVPFGTASSTFITALTKGDLYQGFSIGNLSNPVLSGDTLMVTAENGTTTAIYTITVNPPSSDAKLQNITLSSGSLNPGFSSSTVSYAASVSSNIGSITITPVQNQFHSTIKVNNATTSTGSASDPISISVGSILISIDVTAEDGVSTSTYSINVTREAEVVRRSRGGGGGGGGGGGSKAIPKAVKIGEKGVNVTKLQTGLVRLGLITDANINSDKGSFGKATEQAIKDFQNKYLKELGLTTATGKLDTKTLAKMNTLLKVPKPTKPIKTTVANKAPIKFSKDPKIVLGTSSDDVKVLQNFLESNGFLKWPSNLKKGKFGPLTVEALKKWQAKNKIVPADGTVNTVTIKKLKDLGL